MRYVAERKFEAFYEAEYQMVLALARVLTGDDGKAEDVTQESFVAAYENWTELSNAEGWVRSVVANKARSAWRRSRAERRAIYRLSNEPRPGIVIPPDTEEFWSAVRRLPRRQAQAIALYYLEDRTAAEIGAILGCAESTARKHLSRGRRKLASDLEVGL